MPNFRFVKHRPAKVLPVLLCSVLIAAAFSRLIGSKLVPAMIELGVGR